MQAKLQKIEVAEFTSESPITISQETKIDDILDLLEKHKFRHLPVVKKDKVVGIISDRDLFYAHYNSESPEITARDIMTPDPYTVKHTDSIDSVAYELSKRKVGSAIVVDQVGDLYGIFTVTDALNALVEIMRGEVP